ncbi:glycosyltransferase [Microbacterium sp. R86528]|uniref:glycosyltransferase n=1 Tax=Microbacterium sp. R86528 TaxID=3093864 RepID=UPI0037C80F4B
MAKALMVCSGGGHLKQLYTLSSRLGVDPADQVWVTFENGLSSSLLADREVHYAPFVAPRDLVNLAKLYSVARKVMKAHTYDRAFSTGSSPAVAVLPMAASSGARTYYIESAARADGPSMTGRILQQLPAVQTYTQYPAWQSKRWSYAGSIFDEFVPSAPAAVPSSRVSRAVVTVGTQEGYGFDRLFDALVPLLHDVDEVLWQVGPQDTSRWGIEGRNRVPHEELCVAMREADVVISHAGTGSALTAFEQGKCPILVPRLARYREHVDDHQVQIAREMQRRKLAFMRTPESITPRTLLNAANRAVSTVHPSPMELSA